jgi:tRNA (cmo5U34)-methyltransferase
VLELLANMRVERVLDLGSGDGNLLALVLVAHPGATGVALDFGDEMLRLASERFAADARVEVRRHDLSSPLPADLEGFDAVVSSFAIHHLDPPRVGVLYGEILERLRPGGVFVNAEHVASPTEALHVEFLAALGRTPADDDPSNQLVSVEQQLTWLNACGFVNSECFWKWRELAVVAAVNPG